MSSSALPISKILSQSIHSCLKNSIIDKNSTLIKESTKGGEEGILILKKGKKEECNLKNTPGIYEKKGEQNEKKVF